MFTQKLYNKLRKFTRKSILRLNTLFTTNLEVCIMGILIMHKIKTLIYQPFKCILRVYLIVAFSTKSNEFLTIITDTF